MEIKANSCQSWTSSYEKVQIIFHGSFEDHHLSARSSKSAKYIWIPKGWRIDALAESQMSVVWLYLQ